jgi:hypothetical protein
MHLANSMLMVINNFMVYMYMWYILYVWLRITIIRVNKARALHVHVDIII